MRFDLLTPTDNVSTPEVRNVAWSYPAPLPAVGAIANRVAFYNELTDVRVDGVLLERPESPFSKVEQRPDGE